MPEVLAQLPTNFVGEVIPRGKAVAERREVTGLNRLDWCILGDLVCVLGNVAIFIHLAQHEIPAVKSLLIFVGIVRSIAVRGLGVNGEEGGFMQFQLVQSLVEIALRCGANTEAAHAKVDVIQVNLQHLVATKRVDHPAGEDDLFDLPLCRAFTAEERDFRHLLRDR